MKSQDLVPQFPTSNHVYNMIVPIFEVITIIIMKVHKRSPTQQKWSNMCLKLKNPGVIPSTCFMTKHDNEWADRYPRILMHLTSFNDNLDQRGGIQRWQGQWNMKQEHNGRVPWAALAMRREQWHPTPNYSYIYQTANTKTSVFLITGPKHWQRGRVITQETQEAQKGKSENMPSQRGKKLKPLKLN